jgi:hypothetical protein
MSKKLKPRGRRSCLTATIALIGLCLLLGLVSTLSNIGLPQPESFDRLPAVDKARLAEALHLKSALGNQIWPGWTNTQPPIIIWNHAYEFLIGYPVQPPADWESVPGDTFSGQPYYRRPAVNPQNFAVPVGKLWAASMATKTNTDAFLIGTFRDMFPTPLKQLFPYRLLIQPSETQIGGLLHEDFHVYELQSAPQRLNEAEDAHSYGDQYEASAESFAAEFKQESVLLAQALTAHSDPEAADLVRQFLQARDARRQTYHLDPTLVAYERWLEWEEGMAKYVEVASLRQAYQTAGYSPLPEMEDDPYFKSYQKFNSRWSQELIQLRNLSGSPKTKFYMIGMAESFLLDRLMPVWKSKVMQEGVFLEDLLRQAVGVN